MKHKSTPRKPGKSVVAHEKESTRRTAKNVEPEDPSSADDKSERMLKAVIFLSGFACLVYQILWMRQLGLLFGNTSHAAALTLAVFFLGIAGGSWFWGRRCPRLANPMRTYAWLEFGIAAAGSTMLLTPGLCTRLIPLLYGDDGSGFGLTAFKWGWTLAMVFPAAFLMGGTIPVLGQRLITRKLLFGASAARIYAINTIGAACGAFATAFILIWALGYRNTGLTAIAISIAAAAIARKLSRNHPTIAEITPPPDTKPSKKPDIQPTTSGLSRRHVGFLAFLSGFNILALEVLWTRMFAQVHENSVYSFSTVLIIVLVCLAIGAWLASRLAAIPSITPQQILLFLITAGGTSLCLSPFVFTSITGNLRMLPTDSTFTRYVIQLFTTGFLTIGPPCLLLGTLFPFLMKGEEPFATHPGKSLGRLSAINTLGSITGSLACGFLLLHWIGLWHSMQLVTAIYLIAAILTPTAKSPVTNAARIFSFVMLVLSLTLLNPAKLPLTWTKDAEGNSGTLLETWEASDCTVAVIKNPDDHLLIKINSNYTLGSTDAYGPQLFQSRIPLLAYPDTDSVFFLGMGTGITAGEALNRDDFKKVEKVVTCELSPSVVEASKKYFGGTMGERDLTNGLFRDPRSKVLIEDGRNHLMATREKYAMINADLFLPYRSGSGSLYSLEHFQQVKNRLKPGGVFVQWLPLYQVTENEFGIITRTMLETFPQVTLWRGNFQPGAEMAALVGHLDNSPLSPCTIEVDQDKKTAVEGASCFDLVHLNFPINPQTLLLFYCGNLSLARDIFSNYPLNTDDKPIIEFGTPRALHQPKNQGRPHFVENRFADLVDQLQSRTPPAADPFLTNRSPANRELPLAGAAFHRGNIAFATQDETQLQQAWQQFLKHWLKTDAPANARE